MKLLEFQHIDLFTDLSREQLETEVNAALITLQRGEMFFLEGDTERLFFVVLAGNLQIFRVIDGQEMPINPFVTGQFGGEVPLLAGTPHLACCRATSETQLLTFAEPAFWHLMSHFPPVRQKVLAHMAERLTELQSLSSQREKLVSLGTLAAGLAHELNNPASAAKRSAQNLVKTLGAFGSHSSQLLKPILFKVEDPGHNPFGPLMATIRVEGVDLDTVTQSDLEDELADWLDELDIPEPWNMAEILVSVGFTREALETFAEQLHPEHVQGFILWLAYDVEMRRLGYELVESTGRISGLITAMKSYSYMDQAHTKEKVDIHQGLDTTLTILNHKRKAKRIEIVKEYSHIKPIEAVGSELNQVWTNLLDNAIDAVPENGKITIKTYYDPIDPNMVSIEINDNGPGIPPEAQQRIFDPFFTTKGVGQGTGLGLEIAHRIVVNRHSGSINIDSKPGTTTFKICLPTIPSTN